MQSKFLVVHLSNNDKYIFGNSIMIIFGNMVKALRYEMNIPQRKIAAALDIDTPMYSKLESGKRPIKREQIEKIAIYLKIEKKELLKLWYAEKIFNLISEEEFSKEILDIVIQNLDSKKK